MAIAPRRYTVLFFVDDRAVETFCEHVTAANQSEAFAKAIGKARRSGASRTGHGVRDWTHATEIATFDGHLEQSRT